jgi:transcription elongation factor SPT6
MSARELIDDRALEDEEEDDDDESFDEETGDVRERPNGSRARFEDSSEEDEDDDDEEAAAEVCNIIPTASPWQNDLTFTVT